MIPASVLSFLFVIWTHFEDKTLHEELEGYQSYSTKVKYRLLPGIWQIPLHGFSLSPIRIVLLCLRKTWECRWKTVDKAHFMAYQQIIREFNALKKVWTHDEGNP